MNRLLNIFSKYYVLILFIFLQTISLVIIFQGKNYHKSVFINGVNRLTGNTYNALNNYKQYFQLRENNLLLAEENAQLRANQINALERISREYVHVEDTLYRQRYIYRPAQIVHHTINRKDNFLILNLGAMDGIEPDMGIISDSAVVGLVIEVSDHYCKAFSFLNSKSQISCKVKRNNAAGILSWERGDYTTAWVNDLPLTTKVFEGDTILTSGFSAIYPKGIPLGKVLSVNEDQSSQLLKVKVLLFEDFNTLNHVYIVEHLDREEVNTLMKEIPIGD